MGRVKNRMQEIFHELNENKDQYEAIPGDKWIDKLKYAFKEADTNNSGALTIDQFIRSRIRFVLSNQYMSDKDMEMYFNQVDANGDGDLQWHELVDYMMVQSKNAQERKVVHALNLKYIAPDRSVIQKNTRASQCIRVIHLPILNQLVTLSDSMIKFWNMDDCLVFRTFSEKEQFVDVCFMPTVMRLAIAKENRQVIYYDLRTFSKAKDMISASFTDSEIHSLSLHESKIALTAFQKNQLPLFHRPTSIGCLPDKPYVFVGDEVGRIEIFNLKPSTFSKYGWESIRSCVHVVHSSTITQISYISKLNSMASSSSDGSIILWSYHSEFNNFFITHRFKSTLPVTSFVFENRTTEIIYTTTSHVIGSWHAFSDTSNNVETPSQMVTTIVPVSVSDQTYLLTISCNNLFSIYLMPRFNRISKWYDNKNHALHPPSNSIQVGEKLFLFGAYMSKWGIELGNMEGIKPHNSNILGIFLNEFQNRIISCDESGDVYIWLMENGRKDVSFVIGDGSYLSCISIDESKKRLSFGHSDGSLRIVASNSCSPLNRIEKKEIDGEISSILFGFFGTSKYIFVVCESKCVFQFEDLAGNRLRYVRSYMGHTERISEIFCLKKLFILTIGMKCELFIWSPKGKSPYIKYILENDPTTAADLRFDSKLFICGDIIGQIVIMSINNPRPINAFTPFSMVHQHPISSIYSSQISSTIIVANTTGYIKIYTYQSMEFTPIAMYRAHTDVVENIQFAEQSQIIVTSGRDHQIRLWSLKEQRFIGQLGRMQYWVIDQTETWIKGTPVPTDPSLFICESNENKLPSKDETKQISENKSVLDLRLNTSVSNADEKETTDNWSAFDIQRARNLLNELEEVYVAGKVLSLSPKKKKETNTTVKDEFEIPLLSLYNENGVFRSTSNKKEKKNLNGSKI